MSCSWDFTQLPEAIIFDLDGVLADSETWYRAAWQTAATTMGYQLSPQVFSRMVGHSEEELRIILRDALGSTFPFKEALSIRHSLFNQYLEDGRIGPKPGARELLALLARLGIPRAVATGTPHEMAHRKLSLIGLDIYIPIVESAPKSLNGSPNATCYLRALQRLGTSARGTLAIEDSVSGALAAKKAGLHVIVVPDLAALPSEPAGVRLNIASGLDSISETLQLRAGLRHHVISADALD